MKVSVVVVTYNRSLQLSRGLLTLLRQSRLPDEVVIVDDGSSDDTKEVCTHFRNLCENVGVEFKYYYLDHPEPRISCIPRNYGWKKAEGEIVIFTEPEALQMESNIQKLLDKMKEHPENTILASQVYTMGEKIYKKLDNSYYKNPESLLSHEYAMLTDNAHPHNTKAPDSDWGITGEAHCNAGVLFATRKEWLEEVGGFDESFEGHGFDDFDLFNRLAGVGHGIVKCPDIPVIHQWHEKNYPYNIYEHAEKNGKISEENIHKGIYKVNQ
jgi:GT2 family glycosyltransferase